MTVHFSLFAQIVVTKLFYLGTDLSSVKWKKTSHVLPKVNVNAYIYGTIYKRSQLKLQWVERYVAIKESGIYSYHSSLDTNHTFFIPAGSIKYIWTRFDFIHSYLIVKIKYKFTQTEFGIPVCQFDSDFCQNWLLQFYRLIDRGI